MKSNTFSKYILLSASLLTAAGCNSPKALTKKADAEFFSKGEYAKAADMYKDVLKTGKGNNGYLNGQIGEALRMTNRQDSAAPFYKAAIDAGYKPDSVAFAYAEALKSAGQWDAAAEQFNAYAASGTDPKRVKRAKKEVENIAAAKAIPGKFTHFEVSNAAALNTTAADFSPVFHGTELYFTSGRNGVRYTGDNTELLDLWQFKFDDADPTIGTASALPKNLNPDGVHNASATITKDGKTMVFARSGNGTRKSFQETDLYISRFKDGKWSDAEALTAVNSPSAWDACPSFSPDGKSLYFASNRPGGQGGIDIYRAQQDQNGRWSKVTNMGEPINTTGDDMFPSISDDGKLYFSSDGHPGLGNLDLMVAARDKDTKKVTVENLGVPINSSADDFGITFKNAVEGYFSSNRAGGKGQDDIYYFKNTKDELKVVKFNLHGITKEREDDGTVKILSGTKVKLVDEKGTTVSEVESDAEGKFEFPLAMQKNYTLLAEKPQFYTKREAYTTFGKQPNNEDLHQKETTIDLEHTLTLDKIHLEKTIVMDNIYYDYNKADIKDTAAMELDKLVTLMNDNPKIHIELSSHTDSRGKDEYNMNLSQRRAQSAVDYIVSKGIDVSRITAKGYGKTKPIIENAMTEEDFQKNRRTEFKVVKMGE
ncbi:MAG: OmpA family protein [Bacteroidota bacterium]